VSASYNRVDVKLTVSKGDYLKAIAEAEAEGETVIAATLARWLDVSAPAVTMAVKRLKRDALIQVGDDGHLMLTPEGRAVADHILLRHHLVERMLTEVFGMPWYRVHEEAEQLEHVVSEDFERALIKKFGKEGVCPHGNRLTGDSHRERRQRGLTPLDEVPPMQRVEVASIFERNRQFMEQLDGLGIHPGAPITVGNHRDDGTMELETGMGTVPLLLSAAGNVWVRPL